MKRIKYAVFCMVKFFVKLFYPKVEFENLENLPNEPSLVIGNHTQMNGPIIGELYFPSNRYTWCAGEMMNMSEVPAYAYWDFWRNKPKYIKWFYKILSYIIAPLSVCVFSSAHTIAVYHDKRGISAFKSTVKRLKEGNHIIIFPEKDAPHNHILCDFQDGFVDAARLYYKQTGIALKFAPMYIAPELRKVYFGNPIEYNPKANKDAERERICNYLKDEITKIAVSLPRHKVVPYNNTPKKLYRYNKE